MARSYVKPGNTGDRRKKSSYGKARPAAPARVKSFAERCVLDSLRWNAGARIAAEEIRKHPEVRGNAKVLGGVIEHLEKLGNGTRSVLAIEKRRPTEHHERNRCTLIASHLRKSPKKRQPKKK